MSRGDKGDISGAPSIVVKDVELSEGKLSLSGGGGGGGWEGWRCKGGR